MSKILVYLENQGEGLKRSSNEALTLAKSLSGEVYGLIINGTESQINSTTQFGLNNIINIQDSRFNELSYIAVAKTLSQVAKELGINITFLSANSSGKEIAPRLAVYNSAALLTDIVGLDSDYIATKPVYAGKAQVKIKSKIDNIVFTLRPNVFTAKQIENSSTPASIAVNLNLTDKDFATKVKSVVKSEGKVDVSEASIIVSGGRGMKAPEHFNLIEDLASTLGAAVGASRAVVDAGWRPHSEQVGQTGKTVSPNLYVAVGISGAVQHLAGMSSSKVILAINKDKDAPIFKIADYGIVGDAFEVVPKLIEKIKALG